jgi:hypothetical protein
MEHPLAVTLEPFKFSLASPVAYELSETESAPFNSHAHLIAVNLLSEACP